MNIGELSRRASLAPSAIRYYEEEGLLPEAARVGGKRVFDDAAVARLAAIQFAKDAGFTLAEIKQLIAGFHGERWRALATRKLGEIEAAAARLRMARSMLQGVIACGCFDLEECGNLLLGKAPRRAAALSSVKPVRRGRSRT